MWELNDPAVKEKLLYFARRPHLVTWSRSAEQAIASAARLTSLGVLEAIIDHLNCGYTVECDHMRNGDLAYIFRCYVGRKEFYVKAKFVEFVGEESLRIFSAHPDR